MGVSVRMGTTADLPFVIELAKEATESSLLTIRNIAPEIMKKKVGESMAEIVEKNPNSRLLILEDTGNQQPLGYSLLILNQQDLYTGKVQALWVDIAIVPEMRGKGLWKLLLQEAEEIARKNDNSYIFGMITAGNKRSLAMCEKFGYQVELYQICKSMRES